MSEQQIAKLASALVEHQRHFGGMSTDDRQWAIQNTEAAIGLFADAVKNRDNGKAVEPKKLLEFVTTTSVAALERFNAAENFKVNTKKAAVRICYLGKNFKEHFGRKVEGTCEASEIRVHKLTESSLDVPIIAELGDKAEITLGQFFALLSKQGEGESGPLLTNEWANIAYIRDCGDVLWAVFARWNVAGGGWVVGARSVGHPFEWGAGYQVLSR